MRGDEVPEVEDDSGPRTPPTGRQRMLRRGRARVDLHKGNEPATISRPPHTLQECEYDDCYDHDDEIDEFEHGLVRDSTKRAPQPWWKRALKLAALLVIVGVMIAVLKGKLPAPADIGRALARADWRWVAIAAAGQVVSIFFFSAQQRSLLRTFNVKLTHRRVGAITYASNALTNTLPAGGAVAAGYSYRLYRASGASRSTAATVMVLSGVLSIGALVLLYLAWIGASAAMPLVMRQQDAHPVLTAIFAVVFAAIIALLIKVWSGSGTRGKIKDAPTPRIDRLELKYPLWGRLARDGLLTLRKAGHLRPRDWATALGCSSAKWVLDFFSLFACCLAVDINVTVGQMAAVYLGVQLVRQIPFTPGGIGLIEGALLTALVATGAFRGPAVAAILIYRILSAWLLIPIGFVMMAELKRRDAKRLGKTFV